MNNNVPKSSKPRPEPLRNRGASGLWTSRPGPSAQAKGRSGGNSNAVKSGLFACSPVIKTKYYEESEEDFEKTLEGLKSTFAPQGVFEEALVKELALDFHCRQRGALFESATVRRYQEDAVHQREDEFGIPALKENIEATKERVQALRAECGLLSKLPEDIAQAAESDFEKHRAAFEALYNVMHQNCSLLSQLALERAWKLGRYHFALNDNSLITLTSSEIRQKAIDLTKLELQKTEAVLTRLRYQLKASHRKLKKLMSQDVLCCLLPREQDLEALDRFYSMHNRNMAKTIDMLTKLQFARLNGSRLIGINQPKGNGTSVQAHGSELVRHNWSDAPVNQESPRKEEGEHAA